MTHAVERIASWRRGQLVVALVVPLAGAGLTYLLWSISDRLVVIGPFDRATFGWAFVIPTWIGSSIVTGWLWSFHSGRTAIALAAALFAVLALIVATMFWVGIVWSLQGCAYGPTRVPAEWILPALPVGGIIAGAFSLSALIASERFGEASRKRAVASAIVAAVVINGFGFVTLAVLIAVLFGGGGCNRP